MQERTLSDLNRHAGEILEMAAVQPVALTRYRRVRYILMSADHYRSVTAGGNGESQPTMEAEEPESPSQLSLL